MSPPASQKQAHAQQAQQQQAQQQQAQQQQAQQQAQQHGGDVVHSLQSFFSNLDSPFQLIYGFLLVLTIVYSPALPTDIRQFADSFLGRVFGVALVYGATEAMGWVYGLLTALAFLLILNGAPRYGTTFLEGFDGGGGVTEKTAITHSKRWFVEQVLGECPSKIDTDRVITLPVQD